MNPLNKNPHIHYLKQIKIEESARHKDYHFICVDCKHKEIYCAKIKRFFVPDNEYFRIGRVLDKGIIPKISGTF